MPATLDYSQMSRENLHMMLELSLSMYGWDAEVHRAVDIKGTPTEDYPEEKDLEIFYGETENILLIPTNVFGLHRHNKSFFSWTRVFGAESYVIQRSESSTGPWEYYETSETNWFETEEYDDSFLETITDRTLYYRIREDKHDDQWSEVQTAEYSGDHDPSFPLEFTIQIMPAEEDEAAKLLFRWKTPIYTGTPPAGDWRYFLHRTNDPREYNSLISNLGVGVEAEVTTPQNIPLVDDNNEPFILEEIEEFTITTRKGIFYSEHSSIVSIIVGEDGVVPDPLSDFTLYQEFEALRVEYIPTEKKSQFRYRIAYSESDWNVTEELTSNEFGDEYRFEDLDNAEPYEIQARSIGDYGISRWSDRSVIGVPSENIKVLIGDEGLVGMDIEKFISLSDKIEDFITIYTFSPLKENDRIQVKTPSGLTMDLMVVANPAELGVDRFAYSYVTVAV